MNLCTAPKQIGDPRYVFGDRCMWHAPIALSGTSTRRVDTSSHGEEPAFIDVEVPCCPHCHDRLIESVSEDQWWSLMRSRERDLPEHTAMLRWSQGKCFPDFDTLQNAYWQAMEGNS